MAYALHEWISQEWPKQEMQSAIPCQSTMVNLQVSESSKLDLISVKLIFCIGGSHSQSMSRIFTSMGYNGFCHGGSWNQPLLWLNQDPQTMCKAGLHTKSQVEQVKFLELGSLRYFGARRCIGLAGSYRGTRVPTSGSLLWSVLFRGTVVFLC